MNSPLFSQQFLEFIDSDDFGRPLNKFDKRNKQIKIGDAVIALHNLYDKVYDMRFYVVLGETKEFLKIGFTGGSFEDSNDPFQVKSDFNKKSENVIVVPWSLALENSPNYYQQESMLEKYFKEARANQVDTYAKSLDRHRSRKNEIERARHEIHEILIPMLEYKLNSTPRLYAYEI